MTPWTALLESLHSAFIDELNEKKPKEKVELGLPRRLSQFAFPDTELGSLLFCEIQFDQASGFVFVGLEKSLGESLSFSEAQLWEAIFKRAGSEFMRRNIRPKAGNTQSLTQTASAPKGVNAVQKLVWIPFKLQDGKCYLGMGV